MGSDVLVVDPPRKGLDASLVDALRTISSIKDKAKFSSERLDHIDTQNICQRPHCWSEVK